MPTGRSCPESGRATGLLVPPTRRTRCILCGSLISVRLEGGHLVVSRHWPSGFVFADPTTRDAAKHGKWMARMARDGPMCICVERLAGDAPDPDCPATYHFQMLFT